MLKTLTKSLREHKKASWITILLSMAEVVFEIMIPLSMSALIDNGIDKGSMPAVLKYSIILVIFSLTELIAGFLAAKIAAGASAGFAGNFSYFLTADSFACGLLNRCNVFGASDTDKGVSYLRQAEQCGSGKCQRDARSKIV